MKNVKLALVASALALSFAGVAGAATQGTLGTDSTGTSDIILIKDNAVQISDVGNIDLGTESTLAADKTGSDSVCVFASTGSYHLTVSGARAAFTLEGPTATDLIPYGVTWQVGAGTPETILPGLKSVGVGYAGDATSLNCNGGTNATFAVAVDAVGFNAAAPGTYTDTLTLFVESI